MEYKEKITALVDILGFKNFVNDTSKCEDIGAILKMPYSIRQGDSPKMLKISQIMITSISDSIVFSIGVNERGAMNKITKVLTVLMRTLLLEYGLLIRGGIAVGKLYHDNEVVYGPALVEAHELESKMAVYPRIIMTHADFCRSILSCTRISQATLRKIFVPDQDGFLALDWLVYSKQESLQMYRSKLQQMQNQSLAVQQKISWVTAQVDKRIQAL